MLILRRKEGQWVDITHSSGDTIRIRVYNIRTRYPGQLDLAFDDPDHNYSIQRPERTRRAAATTEATAKEAEGVDVPADRPISGFETVGLGVTLLPASQPVPA